MAIPLYEQSAWHQRLNRSKIDEAHPGLLFDKFVAAWKDNQGGLEDDAKQAFFECIVRHADAISRRIEKNLQFSLQRREDLIDELGGESKSFETEWRFVSGLGAGHPFETGFIWHRTLGVPYLPGSSVKGMMRSWASRWMDDADSEENRNRVERLFGPWETADGGNAGAFIAFDALPEKTPLLEVDILNPHYQPYYENPDHNPPADYYNPVPVFFLTVAPEQSFRFALAPRPGADIGAEDMEWLWSVLGDALKNIGAGGKTAVGYGIMTNPGEREEENRKRLEIQACEWLEKALNELKNDKDYSGQPEKNLWKNGLSKKYLFAPQDLKPLILNKVKEKWEEFGLDWENPSGKSARAAMNNYNRK